MFGKLKLWFMNHDKDCAQNARLATEVYPRIVVALQEDIRLLTQDLKRLHNEKPGVSDGA